MAEAELQTVARPYARAAFAYALDQDGGPKTWAGMLGLLAAAVREPAVQDALDDPQLSDDQAVSLVAELLDHELTPEGRNFLAVLAEHGRLTLLPTVFEMFEHLRSQHERTMDVDVTSAFEVTDAQQQTLAEVLKRRLQRDVRLATSVDESLLGGVLIRAEDTVIDDSVRGRLGKLRQTLHQQS